MRHPRRLAAVCAVVALATITRSSALAQEHVVLRSDVLLYGDNTEFRNPFREGESIFGAAARIFADIDLGSRATLSIGVFGNQRFGSERALELVRPVIALSVTGHRSSFVLGALPARAVDAPMGPDRMGPHALLPPLQRETLTFDRPYEAGLEWIFRSSALRHEAWLNWQRLNTIEHRERFDAGFNGEVRARRAVFLPLQLHVVHQGGQLHASGPVADSVAAAAGARIGGRVGGYTRASIETLALISRYVPDRAAPQLSRDGVAFFGRAAVERAGWRAHLIAWRGRNYIKDEADPNYLSLRRDGTRYKGVRDYAEVGVARRFELAPTASIEVSGRWHRVERDYGYSYRVTSTINVGARLH